MDSHHNILIIEDESLLADSLADYLESKGFPTRVARTLREGRGLLESFRPDLVLLDLTLPDGSGLEMLERAGGGAFGPLFIVFTGDPSLDTAIHALRRNAFDYIVKPFGLDLLMDHVGKALRYRQTKIQALMGPRRRDASSAAPAPVQSRVMIDLMQRVEKVAKHDLPVLVTGETGVGKEYVCRMIHDLSPRAGEPFLAVNCAELDHGALRSELFGHERGAFTDASERKPGLFELSSSGTLMLDEAAEMPPRVQATFLRVLEDGVFRRLGGTVDLHTRARVLAATNRDLSRMIAEGGFRLDLLFRLNTVEIHVPPLRERREDIAPLARFFLDRINAKLGLSVTLPKELKTFLETRDWPGNIRELRNAVERGAILVERGPLTRETLEETRFRGLPARSTDETRPASEPIASRPAASETYAGDERDGFPTLAELEHRHIDAALERTGGNRTRAAEILGISRSTLARKLDASESG
jgi:DNA-binding NtrC family response regulator